MADYGYGKPVGYEQVTVLTSATSLTVPTGALVAVIQAVTQNVRWRDDGTAPTATVGMRLAAGSSFVTANKLSAFQFIEEAASAELNVTYYA